MDIRSWNKETKQAYVGTLLYSLLGILAAILMPFVAVGKLAKTIGALSGEDLGGGGTGVGILLTIVEIAIIVGYIIFFLAIRDLRKVTDGEEQKAFKRIYQSIIFDIIGAVFGILHLGIIGGIFGLVACILLISAYSTLKSSKTISELSTPAVSGFSLLYTAEILVLIGILLGWIPVINIIAAILKAVAWVLVLLGWRKVARPVAIPGEAPEAEKPTFDMIKEVFAESYDEAKEVAKEVAEKSKIVADEVGNKAKEASESIKERLDSAKKPEE